MPTLIHPSGVTNLFLTGTLGTTSTDYFILAADKLSFDFWSPVEECTNETNTYPQFDLNWMLYGRYVASGWAVTSKEIGIQYIINSTYNPQADVEIWIGGGRKITQSVLITRMQGVWVKKATKIPLRVHFLASEKSGASHYILEESK